mgnify:CR=1 FL=1
MGDGRVIATVRIVTEQPLPYLPRLEHYLRTVAEDEDYFSEGRLRPSEAHAIFHYTLRGRGECSVGARTYPVTAGQGCATCHTGEDVVTTANLVPTSDKLAPPNPYEQLAIAPPSRR